jgi:hypothetical protein
MVERGQGKGDIPTIAKGLSEAQRPLQRPLTAAEERGWRYRWCNWEVVCPRCIAEILAEHPTRDAWPVPADYNRLNGIRETDRCTNCARVAGDDLNAVEQTHPYSCDCAACWAGITLREPKPRSLFERVRDYLRSLANDA